MISRSLKMISSVIAIGVLTSSALTTGANSKEQVASSAIEQLSEFSHACVEEAPIEYFTLPWSFSDKEEEIIAWAGLLGMVCPSSTESVVALSEVIESANDLSTVIEASRVLEKVDSQNPFAVDSLLERYRAIGNAQQHSNFVDAVDIASALGTLGPKNPLATAALIGIIQNAEYSSFADPSYVLRTALHAISRVGQDNRDAITLLESLLEESLAEGELQDILHAAHTLGKIDSENQRVASTLVDLFYNLEDLDEKRAIAKVLSEVASEDSRTTNILKHYLSSEHDRYTRYWAVSELIEVGIRDSDVTSTLLSLMTQVPFTEGEQRPEFATVPEYQIGGKVVLDFIPIRQLYAQRLEEIAVGDEEVISALSDVLRVESEPTEQGLEMRSQVAATLSKLAPNNPHSEKALVTVLEQYGSIEELSHSGKTQMILAAKRLADISSANTQALLALRGLLERSEMPVLEQIRSSNIDSDARRKEFEDELAQYAEIQSKVAVTLLNLNEDSEQATDTLVELLSLPNEYAVASAAREIEDLAFKQPAVVDSLEQILSTFKSKYVLLHVTNALWSVDSGNPKVLAARLNLIQNASGYTGAVSAVADSLKLMGSNSEVLTTLSEVVRSHPIAEIRFLAADVLVATDGKDPRVVALLQEALAQAQHSELVSIEPRL